MTRAVTALRNLPASRILAAIASACERWSDADFPPRVRATRAVMNRLDYSEAVVDYAFDRLFAPVEVPALRAVIENELGSVSALDGFAARPHRPDAFARGVDRVTVVSSDTTIGVALWPALFALCAKCDVTVKDRSDVLIGSFAQTLFEEDESFRSALSAQVWDANDEPVVANLSDADVVVAFGRDASLAAIRAHCAPGAAFYGFGHRTSCGYVEREALSSQRGALAIARAVARDALLYDGEGCLSLHALFVERGGTVDPVDFMIVLQRALEEASFEFPSARAIESSVRAQANLEAFRAAQRLEAIPPMRNFALSFDMPRNEPPPVGARSLGVYPVEAPADALQYLLRHDLPLEAFALADPATARPEVTLAAIASGAPRIGRLGRLQSPDFESNHGGAARILPFVRWIVKDR